MDASEKDSGKWSDLWCLLVPFPNSSGWWWLISSVFLTRTSCPKTTHANSYYGAWPGWAVSVSVLLLTVAARGGYSLIAVHGLLIVVAFLVAEHGR